MYKTKEYSYDDLKVRLNCLYNKLIELIFNFFFVKQFSQDLAQHFLKEDPILKKTVDSCQDDLKHLRNDLDQMQSKFKAQIQKREKEINELIIIEIKNKHLQKLEIEQENLISSLKIEINNLKQVECKQQKKLDEYKKRYVQLEKKLENEKRDNRKNEERILRNALDEQTRLDKQIEQLNKKLDEVSCANLNSVLEEHDIDLIELDVNSNFDR